MIYISGKITGNPNYMEQFAEAERILSSEGNRCINPAKVCAALPELTWKQYMVVCMSLLHLCDTIYLLNGWEESKGAQHEHKYAEANNFDVIFESDKEEE